MGCPEKTNNKEQDKFSTDSRDARSRSYQYGGYVEPSQRYTMASDTDPYEGFGEKTATKSGDEIDFSGMTPEEANAARRGGRQEYEQQRRQSGRRSRARDVGMGWLTDALGMNYKKGLFGSEGAIHGIGKGLVGDRGLLGRRGGLVKGVRQLGRSLRKIFSDVHLKENIDFVGKSKDGINIYEWNYNNDNKNRYRGVLAHELKKDYPNAVSKEKEGLAVDYSKIDVDFEKVEKK